jgi:hypothetical protein
VHIRKFRWLPILFLGFLSACAFRNEADTSAANQQLQQDLDASRPLKEEDFKHEFILDEKTKEYTARVSWPAGRPLQIKFVQSDKILSTVDGREANSFQIPCVDNQLSYSLQVVSTVTGTLTDLDVALDCSTGGSQEGTVRRERAVCKISESFTYLSDPEVKRASETEFSSTRRITTSRDGFTEKMEVQSTSTGINYTLENGFRVNIQHTSDVSTTLSEVRTIKEANGLKRVGFKTNGIRTTKYRTPVKPGQVRDEESSKYSMYGESVSQTVGDREIELSATQQGLPIDIGRPVTTMIVADNVKTITTTNDVPHIGRDDNGEPVTRTERSSLTCVVMPIK